MCVILQKLIREKHSKAGSKHDFENDATTNAPKNHFGNGLLVYVYQECAKYIGNNALCFAEKNNGSGKVFACSYVTNKQPSFGSGVWV